MYPNTVSDTESKTQNISSVFVTKSYFAVPQTLFKGAPYIIMVNYFT